MEEEKECELCGGTKQIVQNAGLEDEYLEDCPECVGIKDEDDEPDMTGASDNEER